MAHIVDARALSCSQPAFLARNAITGGEFPILGRPSSIVDGRTDDLF
jgi:hypothetical protein